MSGEAYPTMPTQTQRATEVVKPVVLAAVPRQTQPSLLVCTLPTFVIAAVISCLASSTYPSREIRPSRIAEPLARRRRGAV